MGIFSKIASAFSYNPNVSASLGSTGAGSNKANAAPPRANNNANAANSKDSVRASINKPSTGVHWPNPNYRTSKEAIDAYMSGTYFGPTWEKAKERNPLLTDEALLE